MTDLDSAIARVYGGPLDDFIPRRDAASKELRSAGDRDSAAVIKALRKPSRTAWALDIAALESPEAMDALVAAITGTIQANASGGDVRAAMAQLRSAVRAFAMHAAEVAEHAGYPLDAGALGNAVLAVIGAPHDFALLRQGRLADIPDAGGLDVLDALAAIPAPAFTRAAPAPREDAKAPSAKQQQAERESIARVEQRRAEQGVENARKRAEASVLALRNAESKLQGAEERLRTAEDAVRDARDQHERAREEASLAAAALQEAENALAATRRNKGTV